MARDLSYIERTNDPVLLGNVIDNSRKAKTGFTKEESEQAYKRALEQLWKVVANRNAPLTTLEWDLWYALAAYESLLGFKNGKKSYAQRLRQKIKRSDIFEAASGAVRRGGGSFGFRYLVEINRLDASFESVVLKHAHAFPEDVVERAKMTLDEVMKDKK
jgi:hypothetical protein